MSLPSPAQHLESCFGQPPLMMSQKLKMHRLTPYVKASETQEELFTLFTKCFLIAAAEPKSSAGENTDNAGPVQRQVEVGPTPALCSDAVPFLCLQPLICS